MVLYFHGDNTICHHLKCRKLRRRLGNNLEDYLTRNQGKSLLLGLKMKKILMQVKAITILIRRIKMQIIQSNRMKLQLMNVKGVGSPSSGPVVEDYFQLLGCKDVLYYDFCIKLILGLGQSYL